MIRWKDVVSSNVLQVGWPVSGEPIMYVRYKNGQVYRYEGVSRQRTVAVACLVLSVGKYLNQVIKPKFPSLRTPELDRKEA